MRTDAVKYGRIQSDAVYCSRMCSDVVECEFIQFDCSKSVRKRSDAAEYGRTLMVSENSN